jgi:hypothetical protein
MNLLTKLIVSLVVALLFDQKVAHVVARHNRLLTNEVARNRRLSTAPCYVPVEDVESELIAQTLATTGCIPVEYDGVGGLGLGLDGILLPGANVAAAAASGQDLNRLIPLIEDDTDRSRAQMVVAMGGQLTPGMLNVGDLVYPGFDRRRLSEEQQAFLEYLEEQGKSYNSSRIEFNVRKQLFLENQQWINAQNEAALRSGNQNAPQYANNQFSDMTAEERMQHLGVSSRIKKMDTTKK